MGSPDHLRLKLAPAWSHQGPGTEFTGLIVNSGWPELRGRAALNIDVGTVQMRLDPTAAELRALAHLCTTLADRIEVVPMLEAA